MGNPQFPSIQATWYPVQWSDDSSKSNVWCKSVTVLQDIDCFHFQF